MMYKLIYLFFDLIILNLKIIIDTFIFKKYSIDIIKINDKSYNIEYNFKKNNNNKFIMK